MENKWTPGSNDAFYEVKEADITSAEALLGIAFPSELREFYRKTGYGFIDSAEKNINRILDPLSVADLRMRANEYAYYTDIDLYDGCEEGRLLFFEANEGVLFSIELTDAPQQKIFSFDDKIADSLEEFLEKYSRDNYYFKK